MLETVMDDPREVSIERLVGWIQSHGLAEPAVLFIEASKPLLPIGSQALLLVQPLLGLLGSDRDLNEFVELFEDPAGVERILSRLERGSAE